MITITYTGRRSGREVEVTYSNSNGSGEWGLPMRLDLASHSPTGFEWGYQGSGPAQLALALLAHHLGTDTPAQVALVLKNYQPFKFDVIANLPQRGWTLTSGEIEEWYRKHGLKWYKISEKGVPIPPRREDPPHTGEVFLALGLAETLDENGYVIAEYRIITDEHAQELARKVGKL